MRVLLTRWFDRFARREWIADTALLEAIERAARGLVDAELGGGLIKQRVARAGGGRSGGYRVIVAFRAGDRAVFLYGFAKSERENIAADDLEDLRDLAGGWLAAGPERIAAALDDGAIRELLDERET